MREVILKVVRMLGFARSTKIAPNGRRPGGLGGTRTRMRPISMVPASATVGRSLSGCFAAYAPTPASSHRGPPDQPHQSTMSNTPVDPRAQAHVDDSSGESRAAERPSPPPPSAPPRTRTSAAFKSLVAAAIVLVLLLVFILENTQTVMISYFGASAHMPLGVAFLLAAAPESASRCLAHATASSWPGDRRSAVFEINL